MSVLDKTMDSIKAQLEENITPNYILITEEIHQKLIMDIIDYMPTGIYKLSIEIKEFHGLKVYVVESLPNGADVLAIYIPERTVPHIYRRPNEKCS